MNRRDFCKAVGASIIGACVPLPTTQTIDIEVTVNVVGDVYGKSVLEDAIQLWYRHFHHFGYYPEYNIDPGMIPILDMYSDIEISEI